ncbi:MAG: SPOR domain-containing protein, partial [Enterobacterales bacterium]|nr:SPOR domain-containing protein [Enterobacterales bacterium]MDN6773887.1 SPOR domain-containing protein [Enterobacterales bacterium]
PISNTPTQAAPVQGEQGQQRIDLAGNNMSDALTQQQGQVDSAVQGIDGGANASTLPTAPATLGSGAAVSKPATNNGTAQNIRPIQTKPASTANSNVTKPHSGKTTVSKTPTHTANVAKPTNTKTPATTATKPATHAVSSAVSGANASLKGAPSNHYTLQLSSASRSDSLNAYAKKQNLAHYWVYETTRNGKPWYVLVSGSYSSSAEAKRAVSTLPADVQAKNPWVRPMSQVQKDVKK